MGRLMLTAAEAAEECSCSVRCLERLRYEGGGPPYIRIRGKRGLVRYAPEDLRAWLDSLPRHTSTSEEAA